MRVMRRKDIVVEYIAIRDGYGLYLNKKNQGKQTD